MYLRFLLLALLDLGFNLIGYLVNPVLPLLADRSGNLPPWLAWFQTPDANLDGIGKNGQIEIRFVLGTLNLRDAQLQPAGAWQRYLCRVLWLYRNNAYGFTATTARGPFVDLHVAGAEPADRYPAREGAFLRIVSGQTGRRYFQFRYVKARSNGQCFEANVGWKLGSDPAQIVYRWTPFRTFETQSPAPSGNRMEG